MSDITITETYKTAMKRGKEVGIIYYRDLTGKSRRVFTPACPKAWSKRREELRDELVAGKHNANKATLEQVAYEAIENRQRLVGIKMRPQTFDNDKRHIRLHILPLLGSIQMARLTVGDVNQFITEKTIEGCSPKSIRNIIASLNMVCKYALDKGYIYSNPCHRESREKITGAQKERGGYTVDDINKMLEQDMTQYLRTFITLASLTGLAANEMQGLLWDSVDLKAGTLTVCRTGYRGGLQETKTEFRIRTLPLTTKLWTMMREWKLQCPSEMYVFPSARNAMADQKSWTGLLETLCKHAGVEFHGIGGFRKFYHTQMELAGVPDSIRKYRMGHSKKSNVAQVHYTITDINQAQSPVDIEAIAGRLSAL